MFSGIVEEVGTVASYDGTRLQISASQVLDGLNEADSICVSGACLTVVARGDDCFVVETVPETVRRTNFGALRPGDGVNLERPLVYGGRIGGHLVQGHVDGVARLAGIKEDGNSLRLRFHASPRIMRYVVEKGFVAIDGISLTVTDCDEESFSVAIIPFTRDHTTIGGKRAGDAVNVETDVTAKYVEQLARPYLDRLASPALRPGD